MNTDPIGELVLDAEQIRAGVADIARQLKEQFAGEDVVAITVVPGGILFTADLVRQLSFAVSIDTIACPHTPGSRHNESPILYHPTVPVRDRHVLLLDDAIESGSTMRRLVDYISASRFQPRSVSVATLLVKPGRVDIPARQYFAFEMANDDLLVGYGLPWEGRYRNRPDIARLKFQVD